MMTHFHTVCCSLPLPLSSSPLLTQHQAGVAHGRHGLEGDVVDAGDLPLHGIRAAKVVLQ